MEENIITIRKIDVSKANEAFEELMKKTELILNLRAKEAPSKYQQLTASELEHISANVIKSACEGLPFNPQEVILVSGQKFPDIIAETYYGVEVKSTSKNQWVSTGSSIVETTRDKFVENIYMLFGKLGGTPPEFRCRPYQSVLYDIAVTHSPRYLINMDLVESETIFHKMRMNYDDFRMSSNAIDIVRKYYRKKAMNEGREDMPWWLTSDNIDMPSNMCIRLWNSINTDEKTDLISKCLILFPETLDPKPSATKYNQFVLWLCSYRQIVMPNVRDVFSAGGKIKRVNGMLLKDPVPQVFSTIVKYSPTVRRLLMKPSKEMLNLLEEYNPELLAKGDYYQNWISKCERIGEKYHVPIVSWINETPEFAFL